MAQRQVAQQPEKKTQPKTARKTSAAKTSGAVDAHSDTTTDHDVIRNWVEARGGRPATVKGTGGKEDVGILRIEFGDQGKLEEISWDDFFDKFEENNLAFLYQETLKSGEESRFFKFVARETSKGK